jgi:hypothetical protein
MTRSLPLARPSRAFGFAQIPFAASQAAQVPRFAAEREAKLHARNYSGMSAEHRRNALPDSFRKFILAITIANLNRAPPPGDTTIGHDLASFTLINFNFWVRDWRVFLFSFHSPFGLSFHSFSLLISNHNRGFLQYISSVLGPMAEGFLFSSFAFEWGRKRKSGFSLTATQGSSLCEQPWAE